MVPLSHKRRGVTAISAPLIAKPPVKDLCVFSHYTLPLVKDKAHCSTILIFTLCACVKSLQNRTVGDKIPSNKDGREVLLSQERGAVGACKYKGKAFLLLATLTLLIPFTLLRSPQTTLIRGFAEHT